MITCPHTLRICQSAGCSPTRCSVHGHREIFQGIREEFQGVKPGVFESPVVGQPLPKGWICPKCNNVYSPTTTECYACNAGV